MRFNNVEKQVERTNGEYLFKVYEVNEKTSQAGNEYLQAKVETNEGFKICDNLMFSGKAACKTLAFLHAIGIGDGETWEGLEVNKEDILGTYLYMNVKKNKDDDFFSFPWGKSDYRAYEKTAKAEPKKEVAADPF